MSNRILDRETVIGRNADYVNIYSKISSEKENEAYKDSNTELESRYNVSIRLLPSLFEHSR